MTERHVQNGTRGIDIEEFTTLLKEPRFYALLLVICLFLYFLIQSCFLSWNLKNNKIVAGIIQDDKGNFYRFGDMPDDLSGHIIESIDGELITLFPPHSGGFKND